MSETTKRKCGCEYRSESAASVRKGYELGGYLVKACPEHTPLPRKEKMMELPADILAAAEAANTMGWHQDRVNSIARALLAERLSATERAAKIAEGFDAWPQEGADIAAAIRSQP